MCPISTLVVMVSFPHEPGLLAVTGHLWESTPVESYLVLLTKRKRPVDCSDLHRAPGKSCCFCAPLSKVTPGKKHPEWVQIEHAVLSALKFPLHWEISGQRSHILSVRNVMGLLPCAAVGTRIFVCDSDRQLGKARGRACIFAGVLDSPPTPHCRFSDKCIDSPHAPEQQRAWHIYILYVRGLKVNFRFGLPFAVS